MLVVGKHAHTARCYFFRSAALYDGLGVITLIADPPPSNPTLIMEPLPFSACSGLFLTGNVFMRAMAFSQMPLCEDEYQCFSARRLRLCITQGAVFTEDTSHSKLGFTSGDSRTRHHNLHDNLLASTHVGEHDMNLPRLRVYCHRPCYHPCPRA